MELKDMWSEFEKTGSIKAYLMYKNKEKRRDFSPFSIDKLPFVCYNKLTNSSSPPTDIKGDLL